jgi:hypothetical protein
MINRIEEISYFTDFVYCPYNRFLNFHVLVSKHPSTMDAYFKRKSVQNPKLMDNHLSQMLTLFAICEKIIHVVKTYFGYKFFDIYEYVHV